MKRLENIKKLPHHDNVVPIRKVKFSEPDRQVRMITDYMDGAVEFDRLIK